jgi:putative SOS response-associated peptidase YedK
MCYTAQLDTGGIFPFSFEAIAGWESVEPFPHFLRQSAAARPTVPVITMDRPDVFQPMRWLMVPPWVSSSEELKGIKIWTANARIEDLERKKMYAPLTADRRCIVAFTGFFEWRHEEDGSKTRYYVTLPEKQPLLLPGLYRSGTIDGQPYTSCTVCTMEARGIMRYIHNSTLRQPVVLEAGNHSVWLDPDLSLSEARDRVLELEASRRFVPDPGIDGGDSAGEGGAGDSDQPDLFDFGELR